ncbi:MAG: cytochrome c oxidase subunit II [Gemmatimonadota bacterium]
MRPSQLRPIALLILVVLVLQACGGVYPQSALHPSSDFATRVHDLFVGIFWWAVVVFVVVEGVLLYVLLRFRERPGDARPRPVHGNTPLEIGWTLAPALILVAIAIPTIKTIFVVDGPPPDDPLTVEVVGKQWWWEFRYPELDLVTANEAHIPVGRPVEFRLRSADVVHSFWIPRLGGKRDLVPGRENAIWLTADSAGTYLGQCAEFCGIAHALMGMRVVAEEPAAFRTWVERMRAPAAEPVSEEARQGKELFLRSACIGCHRVAGTPAAGTVGPDLTHVGSRSTLAAGLLPNTPEELARWIQNPQQIKPGNFMLGLGLTDEQAARIAAYLSGLK